MGLSFWEYARLGRAQWHGQRGAAKRLIWYLLGLPDIHTRIRNTHACNTVERLGLPPGTCVVDIGCGRGATLFYLARKHPDWALTGIELDDEMVRSCRDAARSGEYRELRFVQADINSLSAKQEYDLALCGDVLEHVPDDLGMLRRIRSSLTPGGYFVLLVPRRHQDQWRLWAAFREHEVDGHVRDEYTENELRQVVEQAGFVIEELNQTFGKAAEIAFEINQAFWRRWRLRQAIAIVTYPVTLLLGYGDTRRFQQRGNSFLVLARRP